MQMNIEKIRRKPQAKFKLSQGNSKIDHSKRRNKRLVAEATKGLIVTMHNSEASYTGEFSRYSKNRI